MTLLEPLTKFAEFGSPVKLDAVDAQLLIFTFPSAAMTIPEACSTFSASAEPLL